MLAAVGESKRITLLDSHQHTTVAVVYNAHISPIGHVRFIRDHLFGTCGNDKRVLLWDARNLKSSVRTLRGHRNHVRNLEFSARDGLLLSSGFDGQIFAWQMNYFGENDEARNLILRFGGLTRMRLTPDASKLIISTMDGYLLVVNNLVLSTLADDYDGFRPNLYRVMQKTGLPLPSPRRYAYLFSSSRKRNRATIISDFPKSDKAEIISSLELHPQGWCTVSRNLALNNESEWTCVHDIQDMPSSEDESGPEDDADDNASDVTCLSGGELESDLSSDSADGGSLMFEDDASESSDSSSRHQRVGILRRTYSWMQRYSSVAADATPEPLGASPGRSAWSPSAEMEGMLAAGHPHTLDAAPHADSVARARNAAGDAAGASGAGGFARSSGAASSASAPQPCTPSAAGGPFPEATGGFAEGADSCSLGPHHPPPSVWSTFVRETGGDATGDSTGECSAGEIAGPSGTTVSVSVRPPSAVGGDFKEAAGGRGEDESGASSSPSTQPASFTSLWSSATGAAPGGAMPWRWRSELPAGQPGEAVAGTSTHASAQGVVRRRGLHTDHDVTRAGRYSGRDHRASEDSRERMQERQQREGAPPDACGRNFSRQIAPTSVSVPQNSPRLTHFIQELNIHRGHIKEVSFSADGRIICSPFHHGVRLLSFAERCSEFSSCYPANGPVPLHELSRFQSHNKTVVSTAFSPRHMTLVTACLKGEILWNEPHM
ncbi:Probable histone-binding protein Caf1 [Gryllus bimaculatus]|nr:Probable histone-binding protein Caf1 [Gryllus bimaculatus]